MNILIEFIKAGFYGVIGGLIVALSIYGRDLWRIITKKAERMTS